MFSPSLEPEVAADWGWFSHETHFTTVSFLHLVYYSLFHVQTFFRRLASHKTVSVNGRRVHVNGRLTFDFTVCRTHCDIIMHIFQGVC